MIGFYYAALKQIVASKTSNWSSKKVLKFYFLRLFALHWHVPYQLPHVTFLPLPVVGTTVNLMTVGSSSISN
jgi:hypothetical protein